MSMVEPIACRKCAHAPQSYTPRNMAANLINKKRCRKHSLTINLTERFQLIPILSNYYQNEGDLYRRGAKSFSVVRHLSELESNAHALMCCFILFYLNYSFVFVNFFYVAILCM